MDGRPIFSISLTKAIVLNRPLQSGSEAHTKAEAGGGVDEEGVDDDEADDEEGVDAAAAAGERGADLTNH